MDVSKFPKEIQKLLKHSKADQAIKNNMIPDDLAGIFKEARGIEIFDRNGKLRDHVYEGEAAMNAVRNQLEINTLKKIRRILLNKQEISIHDQFSLLCSKGQYLSQEAQLLRQKLNDLSKLKDTYSRLIKEQECQIKNEFRP
jgi:hypothetical protein